MNEEKLKSLKKLKSLTGLTEKEVKERLKKFGFNELSAKKEYSDLQVFIEQFKSPLIYILVFAGLVTLFLQDFIDTSVIFAAVLMNTVLGFFLGILGSLFVALFIKVIDFKVTDNPNMFYGMFLFLSIVALITVICFYYKLKH